jgi:hypothetical protein
MYYLDKAYHLSQYVELVRTVHAAFRRIIRKRYKETLKVLSTGTTLMIKALVVASALTMSLTGYAVAQDKVTGAPGPAPNTHPPKMHMHMPKMHMPKMHMHKPMHHMHKPMHKPMAAPMAAPADAPK